MEFLRKYQCSLVIKEKILRRVCAWELFCFGDQNAGELF